MTERLIRWYAKAGIPPQVRTAIVNAVIRLRGRDATMQGFVEQAFEESIYSAATAAAAASLLNALRWSSARLAAALSAALDGGFDKAEFDWPVHAALRMAVTPPPPPEQPIEPNVNESELEELRKTSPAEYRDKMANLAAARRVPRTIDGIRVSD